MTTITGARILAGQKLGKLGEEHTLSFETFEHTALSKTYTINQQTPDSAGTMTAIMTGHKTNAYIINYDQNVELGNHKTIVDFGGSSQRLPILTEELENKASRLALSPPQHSSTQPLPLATLTRPIDSGWMTITKSLRKTKKMNVSNRHSNWVSRTSRGS